MTPTKEQIEAESKVTKDVLTACYLPSNTALSQLISRAIATARLEGRNAALDEAVEAVRKYTRYDGPFTDYGDHAEDGYRNGMDDAESAILALKDQNP